MGFKYLPKYMSDTLNVYDAAIERTKWIFDEFDGQVAVWNSGGKDSTVVVEIAAQVARELGCPPVPIMWIDQELELDATVQYQRYLAYEREDIDFRWYQIPFLMDNSTSVLDSWLHVWGEGEEWMRAKEPTAITENVYGYDRFYDLLSAIPGHDFPTGWAILDGMRKDESGVRRLQMTTGPVYKWTTWSAINGNPRRKHIEEERRYRFHPIYDWTFQEVWKAIDMNEWRYNQYYEYLYRYGVPHRQMRVSNFTHEGGLSHLHWLQEVEPETWEKATRRLAGVNTYGKLWEDHMPRRLPHMFGTWMEYALHLIEHLPQKEEDKERYLKQKEIIERISDDPNDGGRVLARNVIGGDISGTYIQHWRLGVDIKRREKAREKSGYGTTLKSQAR